MTIRGLRTPPPPEAVRAFVGNEQVLAWSPAVGTDDVVVVGMRALSVTGAASGWSRPWHEVDSGSWDGDSVTLRVSWVDGTPPRSWRLPGDSPVPALFRARVQASVVIADHVDLGPSLRAKVVIRKDLRDQSLIPQVVVGPGSRLSDPALSAAVASALARLSEQVGLA